MSLNTLAQNNASIFALRSSCFDLRASIFILTLLFPLALSSQEPIIDMHLHDYTASSYFSAPDYMGRWAPESFEDYQAQVDSILVEYNIVKAVVSTIGGDNRTNNPRFINGYYTNTPPEDTVAFKEWIEKGKIQVFGEIGAVYAGFTLSDPKFEPYLDICERYDIPVAIHTGGGPPNVTYRGAPNFRLIYGDPFTIEDVLAKHPKLRIYIMHAGEVYWQHALRLMLQYTQVYADLGVVLWVHEMPMDYAENFLRKAKQYGLLNRVMFGSDQMVWPHGITLSIEKLNSYDFLTEEEKRKIFYYNALEFLGLEEE